jgi:oxygen-independent coproporphyrinogen III oxidase
MSFSLYVHIPYCLSKCPYCDFNAYGVRTWPEERYVDALCAELQQAVTYPPWKNETVATLYFGGGTPSLFAPTSIQRFVAEVARLCPLSPELEVTLEADPASVTLEKLAAYRALGINRLSLGIQSFEPAILKTLGRLHSAEDARRVLTWARESGFANVNVDVIFAVPGQTQAMLQQDLEQVFACAPEHVSIYNLTYEEGTPFFTMRQKGRMQPLSEDEEVAMYAMIRAQCAAHDFVQYEISNFARPNYTSRHNTSYWQGQSYLGLGAGAHSFAHDPNWGARWSNERHPGKYTDRALDGGDARLEIETLSRSQALGEFVFLQLRQLSGFAEQRFVKCFGLALIEAFPHIETLVSDGLLAREAGQLKLTERGLLLADTVFSSFF